MVNKFFFVCKRMNRQNKYGVKNSPIQFYNLRRIRIAKILSCPLCTLVDRERLYKSILGCTIFHNNSLSRNQTTSNRPTFDDRQILRSLFQGSKSSGSETANKYCEVGISFHHFTKIIYRQMVISFPLYHQLPIIRQFIIDSTIKRSNLAIFTKSKGITEELASLLPFLL